MTWWRKLSIRARLAVFFTTAMSLVLMTYAAYVATSVHERLKTEIAHRLDQEVEIVERSLIVNSNGQPTWYAPSDHHEAYQPLRNVTWLDLHRPDGTLIYRVPATDTPGMDTMIPAFEAGRMAGYFSLAASNGAHLRVLQRDIEFAGEKVIARAALSEDQAERDLQTLYWVMGLGLPLAITLSGLGGFLMAGRALNPITRMVVEARAIHAERLDARLPIDNPGDELGLLATTFNELFARLELSFEQLRRFTADASHELRTPLAVIRSVGEVGLREHHDETMYRDIIGAMLEEVDRLTLLVESLLTLTRGDSGQVALALQPVDLTALAEQVVTHLKVLAEEKEQNLSFEASGPIPISADAAILRHALVNLLDNAIKYTPPNAQVAMRLYRTDTEAVVDIADAGLGIPPEHQDRVFDRFYRIDASRNRAGGGFGLGLAITRWAVEAHGGHVEVASSSDQGSVFRVVLPLSIPSPAMESSNQTIHP